jgi:hypothetical protein
MQRRRFLSASALSAGAALMSPVALARRLFPADVTDRYVAWRGQRVVGRQEISFKREPGQFVVEVKIGMQFVAPGIGDVSYSHESREVWDAGWLQTLDSHTRSDGRTQRVHAERQSGSLIVNGSYGHPIQVSTYLVPSNLWHRDSRLVDAFLDVENGSVLFVHPRYIGKQILQQGGGQVEARRYTLRGQLNRESWYDADCVLVRWDLPTVDGGWIRFLREMS